MTDNTDGHGNDSAVLLDFPTSWCKATEVDHATNAGHKNEVHPHEALEDLWNFLEEIGVLDFLGSGTPLHVNAKHVSENSAIEMEWQTAEEDAEHGHPFEVFGERGEETLLV